jgi:ATP-dependent helicase/nuclease subunit B
VTEIETWQRDPFAIHARHVLRLRPLDPIDQPADAAEIGSLIHDGLNRFLAAHGLTLPSDPVAALQEAMAQALAAAALRPALAAWWRPRLDRIAGWVAAHEAARRPPGSRRAIGAELAGDWRVTPGFRLTGRADRIECLSGSGGLVLIDYKSGMVASRNDVMAGKAPQLPLEAAMAAAGAFGGQWHGNVAALAYWKLTGGAEPGEECVLSESPDEVREWAAQAEAGLRALIDRYADPATPYLAQPQPGLLPRFPAYARLARQAEWEGARE